jgi:hypothetical protein
MPPLRFALQHSFALYLPSSLLIRKEGAHKITPN